MAWFVAAAAIVAVVYVGSPNAAPAPTGKPAEQWEYCELLSTSVFDRTGRGRGGLPADAGGLPVPVQPVRPAIRLVTGDGEVEAASWEDLSVKLKMPAAKQAVNSAAAHKIRVLNHLGSQGWELVSGGAITATSACLFKRKAMK